MGSAWTDSDRRTEQSEGEIEILTVVKGLNKDKSVKNDNFGEKSAKLHPMEEVNIWFCSPQKYMDIFLKNES